MTGSRAAPGEKTPVGAPFRRGPAGSGELFARGRAPRSGWYGDRLPEPDFPMLTELFSQGGPPLEKSVREEISPVDGDAAFEKSCRGEVLRSVVTFC